MKKYYLHISNEKLFKEIKAKLPLNSYEFIDDFNDTYLIEKITTEKCVHFLVYINNPDNPLDFSVLNHFLSLYFKLIYHNYYSFHVSLLGFLSKILFRILYPHSEVLQLPNLEYVEINTNFLDNILEKNKIENTLTSLYQSILKLNIKPQMSYLNHHSISNAWCSLKWIRMLKPDSKLENIHVNKEHDLYIDYMLALHHIEFTNFSNYELSLNKINLPLENEIKIMIIDDELELGWKNFWDLYFQKILYSEKIKCIFYPTHNLKYDKFNKIVEDIKNTQPHIIIIDLLLLKNELTDYVLTKDLLSYKIITHVKTELNHGIQILVFTAQDSLDRFHDLMLMDIDAYSLKENFDLFKNYNYLDKINMLTKNIEFLINRTYLIDIYNKKESIKKIIINISNYIIKHNKITNYTLNNNNYFNDILNQLDVGYKLIYHAKNEIDYIHAYLSFQLILEILSNAFITLDKKNKNGMYFDKSIFNYIINFNKDKNKYELVKISDNENIDIKNISQGNKFLMGYLYIQHNIKLEIPIELDKYQNELNNIYKFFSLRNNFVHNQNESINIYKKKSLFYKIIQLVDFLHQFMNRFSSKFNIK